MSKQDARLRFGLKGLFVSLIAIGLALALVTQLGAMGALIALPVIALGYGLWLRTWEYIAVGATSGIVFAVLALLGHDAREAARKSQCSGHCSTVRMALLNYHSNYGSFPPASITDENGRPMHSWRVLLLPFLEQGRLYDRYDFSEPWDGPNNRKLAGEFISVYRCPSEPASTPVTMTNFVFITGPGTPWPDANKGPSLEDFVDGAATTFLFVEVADSGIHWMEPRDFHIQQMNPQINSKSGQGISSRHRGGAHVSWAGGHNSWLSEQTDVSTVRAMMTIHGGENLPGNWGTVK